MYAVKKIAGNKDLYRLVDGYRVRVANRNDDSVVCGCQIRFNVPEPLDCHHSIRYHDAYEASLYTPENDNELHSQR